MSVLVIKAFVKHTSQGSFDSIDYGKCQVHTTLLSKPSNTSYYWISDSTITAVWPFFMTLINLLQGSDPHIANYSSGPLSCIHAWVATRYSGAQYLSTYRFVCLPLA